MRDIDLMDKMLGVDVNKLLQRIGNEFERKNSEIKHLQEEIKKLKDSDYKDIELANMESKLNEAKQDLYRGFPITEDDENRIEEWKRKHEEEAHGLKTLEDRMRAQGCCGGVYEYRFIPTSIGVVGEIICDKCGAKFTFQEFD